MLELEKELRIKIRDRDTFKSETAAMFEVLVEEINRNRWEIARLLERVKNLESKLQPTSKGNHD